ncbi:mannan endo-1,4-beta-mannosidase [Natronoflexus pectinivorans]|uniref:Mannan endo-1,4-beta-mannosidase n=2 Tax=Natronoflexus pectinivorans TaxID=682526 RepID=A0A4R2GNC4_9BACT|nr:mannan endo-1,4-beta-mannosidase [Natronoflexus pectinivorans]
MPEKYWIDTIKQHKFTSNSNSIKMIRLFLLFILALMVFPACSEDRESHEPPVFKSSFPADGATEVRLSAEVEITFDEVITLSESHGITVNEKPVEASSLLTKVVLNLTLEYDKHYSVNIPAGAVINTFGVPSQSAVSFSFTTVAAPQDQVTAELVVNNPSSQAINLFNFLIDNYGEKSISGAMANVSWNINEAEWVYQHTGKYPAMNGFDIIHLWASPANWIDYTDVSVVEDWWNNNGIVHFTWHWNVPVEQGGTNYAFYTNETSFDIREAVKEGTWENEVIMADLEKAADVLELLRDKGIPVLWRPLHEAAGTWFWWGAKGAEPCKQLWRIMFDYFESRQLNNLIWVWTVEPNDDDWYPGDQYVDMIGRDIYNRHNAQNLADEFNSIQSRFPGKIISLSECGNLSTISSQWEAGAKWSFFMPWYDYSRTVNMSGTAFSEESHEFANADWWRDAFSKDFVLTRDQMPDLK